MLARHIALYIFLVNTTFSNYDWTMASTRSLYIFEKELKVNIVVKMLSAVCYVI